MTDSIKRFVARLNVRDTTRHEYSQLLLNFSNGGGQTTLDDIELGIEFVSSARCARTRNRRLVVINLYRRSRDLDPLPLKSSKVPKHAFNTTRILESFEALLPRCKSERDRALLALLRFGGLRISEAITLRVQDVSFPNNQLQVNITQSKTTIRDPLVWRATKFLRDYLCRNKFSPGDWLFPSSPGCHVAARTVENWLQRESNSCGYRISPHDLRRLCATEMASKFGARVLMDYFGWSSLATAEIYIDKARGSATEAILSELGIGNKSALFDTSSCWRCGTANQQGAVHCSTCGELLDKTAIPQRERIDMMDESGLETLLVEILKKRGILPP